MISGAALTNAAKHGDGSATVVTEWDDERLSMQVVNAAGSPDESSGELGLTGIRERAAVNGDEATAGLIGHEFVVDAWVATATVRMSDDRSEP